MNGFTPDQARAIEAGGNVLVQAGAGTGKTRTLVQRCVNWLLADPAHSLDRILMVTFTEAAATEMRLRIRNALSAHPAGQADAPRLAEQIALLDTAHISTLHGFCLRLVRQYFYELNLDPQITVLPAEEAHLLGHEVLDAVLRRHYAGDLLHSEAVQQLIQAQGRGWDRPIRKLVLRLHEYTQTLPDPDSWFRDQLAMFAQPEPIQWACWLGAFLSAWRESWITELRNFSGTPGIDQALDALSSMGPVRANFDEVGRSLGKIVAAGDTGDKKLWPRGTVGKVRDPVKDFFDEADFLLSLTEREEVGDSAAPVSSSNRTPAPSKPLTEDWQWSREPMTTLLQLAREFADAFSAAKRELGAVDFHDLEQFSLRLLWDSGASRPTPLALHWRERLERIFVDEYQDINAAQDAILRALGREGADANRFLVGDVKQSIYRFRLADPHIFQDYEEAWRNDAGSGRVIPLQDNFRSHESILEFINSIFGALMRREAGGVEFGPDAALNFGNREGRHEWTREGDVEANPATEPPPHVELHLLLTGGGESREAAVAEETGNGLPESSDADHEARLLGRRLQEIRSGHSPVWDDGLKQWRPVDWKDMVILLRSRKNKAESFAREFARLGIPLVAPRSGFLESAEVMDLLNLLALLDNPLQDIPAIAVLRSPLVGLSLDELAAIRLAVKGRFWTALQYFHRTRPAADAAGPVPKCAAAATAFPKVERFLKSFHRWRRMVRETSLSRCLEQILDDTHYPAWLLTQPRGTQRHANLSKLLSWARQFDQFHRRGLFRFLRSIEAQHDAGIDHEPAPAETANAVRLMTIHQSKGLEFPVVAVAGLGKAFNLSDLRDDIILDEHHGLCPKVKPPLATQRYPSLPHWLAERRQRSEALGEEMRILYVAFTRACQTLILSGTASRKSAGERWSAPGGITPRQLLRANSCLDWLGPWMSRVTNRPDWFSVSSGATPLLRWEIHDENDPRLLADAREESPGTADEIAPLQPESVWDLVKRLEWKYPFASATVEPAKTSVSALRRRHLDEAQGEVRPLFVGDRRHSPSRPRTGLSAADTGTAHHVFIEHLELEEIGQPGGLEREAGRMEQEEVLSAEQRAALDLDAIEAFWTGDIGREILAHKNALHREMPFTARIATADLDQAAGIAGELPPPVFDPATGPHSIAALGALPDEFVIVQGVVDLAVLLPDQIWVLDFKTDVVGENELAARTQRYAAQLKIYSIALELIHRKPVTRRWLHFLSTNQSAEL
jgi:ATP-dependent helicase/nuclease subunit A